MKRITLITGHYGSGKTNFAVNLALRQAAEGKKVTVVDLDIVNPYFRTADFAELFEQNGIHLEKTLYANTSLDIPAISFDLARLAYEEECLIIDVGGDDAGANQGHDHRQQSRQGLQKPPLRAEYGEAHQNHYHDRIYYNRCRHACLPFLL